ncbi:dephospho-CoA kinase [Thiomicrospira sp. R3]|uniref:dephospho-CoA kinase n=1 Tax=Thiomicrospira sp. R3 TaxID=3035472 RepID=UPI00259B5D88|nr:dephospho-CoA kinase [Thiomicrospira sp. R3]WFE67831.1 dephospho-CoA kinase [Thiomicrospira sp. R3]
MKPSSQIIGVTGGIGCGKSAVCNVFENLGYPVIDTDQVAKRLAEPEQPGLVAMIELLGKDYLTPEGTLDRKKLADAFFSQPELKQQIEAILHPLVRQTVRQQIEQLKPHHRLIFVAIPVLNQINQPEYQIDHLLLIECDEQLQIQRVQQRDQRSLAQIQQIIKQQAPRQQRQQRADSILTNNTSLQDLEQKALAWLSTKIALR